jgi:3-hexulose-6-phosphate synthase
LLCDLLEIRYTPRLGLLREEVGMKLQLALDDISLAEAISLGDKVQSFVDIIEIGTPFILEEGMAPVRAFKARYPNLEILADTKIMDAGEYEAKLAFDAGADYVTVLGVTDLATIEGCLKAAQNCNKAVVVDMICVSDMPQRIAQLERMGVTALAVHTGVDQQAAGRTPLDDLRLMKAHSRSSTIFVAGGIRVDTLPRYIQFGADVAIVGSAIRHSADPVKDARAFRDIANRLSASKRTA